MKKSIILLGLVTTISLLSGCSLMKENSNNNNSSENRSSQDVDSTSTINLSETPPTATFNEQNSKAVPTTIKKLKQDNGTSSNNTKLYRITGCAQWPSTNKNGYTYGNFDLLDDTDYIEVYGCSAKALSLVDNGTTYTYNTSYTFKSMNIKPGDYIEMEGLYVWYSGAGGVAEFQGYVTRVWSGNAPEIEALSYTQPEPTDESGDFYSGINDADTGMTLMTKLHNLMDEKHEHYILYSSLYNHFKKSDAHPSGGIRCFYSGKATTSINREHVWARSLSGGGTSASSLYQEEYGGSDLHHLRPAIAEYNSQRSNAAFGPVYGNKKATQYITYSDNTKSYQTGNVFEPSDTIKGDIARIIMYMYIHYSTDVGGNSQTWYGQMKLYYIMSPSDDENCKKLLRQWNAIDPVSPEEITRNKYAAEIQGNRNPFIDHPTYADRIFA